MPGSSLSVRGVEKTGGLPAIENIGQCLPVDVPAVPFVPLPVWGTADTIRELFGVAPKQLTALVAAGEIRKRKMGHTQQATALFRCLDVLEWLEGCRDFPE